MVYLPPEILGPICQTACTDGGKTGRSLALASKYLNAISEPFQFQSIVLSNVREAQKFLSRLEGTPLSGRGVVELSLTGTLPSPPAKQAAFSFISRLVSSWKAAVMVERRTWEEEEIQVHSEMEQLVIALAKILAFISPTLDSLTIDLISPTIHSDEAECFSIPYLPSLRSLTIKNRTKFRVPSTSGATSTPLLPSLKYLDFIGRRLESGIHVLYRILETMGPSLTHIRLPWEFAMLLEEAAYDGSGVTIADRLPQTIERLFIQLLIDPDDCQSIFPYKPTIMRLHTLAKRDERIVMLYRKDADLRMQDLILIHRS